MQMFLAKVQVNMSFRYTHTFPYNPKFQKVARLVMGSCPYYYQRREF